MYELELDDIKQIIAEKFKVSVDNVEVTSCGYDDGDLYYPPYYYCTIRVEGVKE